MAEPPAETTRLYRLSREAFDAYARAYYRDPRYGAAAPLATSAVGVDASVLDGPWPFTHEDLLRLPKPLHRRIGTPFRAAWGDAPLYARGRPNDVRGAVETGRRLDHVLEQPSTGARFLAPRYVARATRFLGTAEPDAAAFRDGLRAVLTELEEEDARGQEAKRALEQNAEQFDRLTSGLGLAFVSLFRSDLAGAGRGAAAVASGLAGLIAAPPLPPLGAYDPEGYRRAIAVVRGHLAALDTWEASGAPRHLADLRAFFHRAADAAEYVVVERGPRLL